MPLKFFFKNYATRDAKANILATGQNQPTSSVWNTPSFKEKLYPIISHKTIPFTGRQYRLHITNYNGDHAVAITLAKIERMNYVWKISQLFIIVTIMKNEWGRRARNNWGRLSLERFSSKLAHHQADYAVFLLGGCRYKVYRHSEYIQRLRTNSTCINS